MNNHFTVHEIRRGAYYDSIVLMQLQKALVDLPGVVDAGVVMATPANKDVLRSTGFDLTGIDAKPDDLLLIVKGESEVTSANALSQVDELLKQRRSSGAAGTYRPKSLKAAVKALPEAEWVLVSVPGKYAAGVAEEALDLGQNVFLYSDNVSLKDEISLKSKAVEKGLLLMGPDCGTAIINGVGLGFANRVRRGNIGVVAASGTGLQAVAVGIHNRDRGISQAIGTGGRDLKAGVDGRTVLQAIATLKEDPETEVIVLISKPPEPALVSRLMHALKATGKPCVVNLLGYPSPGRSLGNIHFATSLDHSAELAIQLSNTHHPIPITYHPPPTLNPLPSTSYVRGLFSGGTLAYETVLALQNFLNPLFTNVPIRPEQQIKDVWRSQAHTIIDMGEDDFTQGRLHPMMDQDLRLRRLRQEVEDEQVGFIMLDVVLGEGAHDDPAEELRQALAILRSKRPELRVACLVIGTDTDPQNTAEQIEKLEAVGAQVYRTVDDMVAAVFMQIIAEPPFSHPVNFDTAELAAINVGVETFFDSLQGQGAKVLQIDWRPPAGGNEKMMALLAKLKSKS